MSSIFSGILGGGAGLGGTIAIGVYVDGNGSAILGNTTSVGLPIPFQALITGWEMLADRSGNIEMDIWKGSYAAYPLSAANSIVGVNPPAIVSDIKSKMTTLAGWNLLIMPDENLMFHVNSASAIQICSLTLFATKMS